VNLVPAWNEMAQRVEFVEWIQVAFLGSDRWWSGPHLVARVYARRGEGGKLDAGPRGLHPAAFRNQGLSHRTPWSSEHERGAIDRDLGVPPFSVPGPM